MFISILSLIESGKDKENVEFVLIYQDVFGFLAFDMKERDKN